MSDIDLSKMTPAEIQTYMSQLQSELTQLQSNQKVKSKPQKRVGQNIYVPMGRTGEALKNSKDYSQEELLKFKQKNLLKRARELRATAEWNLMQAEDLEKQAQSIQDQLDLL